MKIDPNIETWSSLLRLFSCKQFCKSHDAIWFFRCLCNSQSSFDSLLFNGVRFIVILALRRSAWISIVKFLFYVPEIWKNKQQQHLHIEGIVRWCHVHSLVFSLSNILERKISKILVVHCERPSCVTDRSLGGSKAAELFNAPRLIDLSNLKSRLIWLKIWISICLPRLASRLSALYRCRLSKREVKVEQQSRAAQLFTRQFSEFPSRVAKHSRSLKR